jgi:hypothetical protein
LVLALEIVLGYTGVPGAPRISLGSPRLRGWLAKYVGQSLTEWLFPETPASELPREAVPHKRFDGELLVAELAKSLAEIENQIDEHEKALSARSGFSELPSALLVWLQRLTGAQRQHDTKLCLHLIDADLESILEVLSLEAHDFHPGAEHPSGDFRIETSSQESRYVTVEPVLYRRGAGRLRQGLVSAPNNGSMSST